MEYVSSSGGPNRVLHSAVLPPFIQIDVLCVLIEVLDVLVVLCFTFGLCKLWFILFPMLIWGILFLCIRGLEIDSSASSFMMLLEFQETAQNVCEVMSQDRSVGTLSISGGFLRIVTKQKMASEASFDIH